MSPGRRRYDVVLFDFDGVLCHDRFYTRLISRHPETRDFVEHQVFGGDSDIARRWMRGELASKDVNRLIARQTELEFEEVHGLFLESVAEMRVDSRMIALAGSLSEAGAAVGLVTCNMDVFSEITIGRLSLDKAFASVVNSSDYGLLKDEAGGRLFDIAMASLGREDRFAEALLIDDSSSVRAVFRRKGGHAFPYRRFDVFRRWAELNLELVPPPPEGSRCERSALQSIGDGRTGIWEAGSTVDFPPA